MPKGKSNGETGRSPTALCGFYPSQFLVSPPKDFPLADRGARSPLGRGFRLINALFCIFVCGAGLVFCIFPAHLVYYKYKRPQEFIVWQIMSKYKYYIKKPRSEITKDILKILAVSGVVALASTSPYFGSNLARLLSKKKKYKPKKVYDTFYQLRKQGCIEFKKRNRQIYIRLTEEGRKRAGLYQINSLKIKHPKKWDGKWRLAFFDIKELQRIKREAFRGILKTLGLKPFQQSVWIYPYECRDEIDLLRDFFGLTQAELRYIVTSSIGEDAEWRKEFRV